MLLYLLQMRTAELRTFVINLKLVLNDKNRLLKITFDNLMLMQIFQNMI